MSRPDEQRDDWSADDYSENARFVSTLGLPVLHLLAPQPGESILDLGCGDGVLTRELAAMGANVTAVDASADMVEAARRNGIEAQLIDGHELAFERQFEAVFSNAALHWMTRPERVIAGVARSLRPGGRFVGEFGGMGNVAAIRTALVALLHYEHGIETTLDEIWYFPTVDEYSEKLGDAGFSVELAELIHRPTPAPTGIVPWLKTLAAPALALLPEPRRDEVARSAARLLAPALKDRAGQWMADYVRLRFRAVLK